MSRRLIRFLLALGPLPLGTAACAEPVAQAGARSDCEQQWVALTGRIVDEAELLPQEDEAKLTEKLDALERRNGRQLVIATVATLQGRSIEVYSLCLANHWEVGRKDVNDGVVMLVAPNERKIRIEVGLGVETVVTDEEAKTILDEVVIPAFKAGDFSRGIASGIDALVGELQ